MYDITGGWRIGRRHRRLDAASALAHCPTLPSDRLSSGFVYYDAQADDARLTLAVARTAADHGAVVVNRCEDRAISTGNDGEHLVAVRDVESGRTFDVTGRCVVSAAGIWSDEVRELDEGADPDTIRPAKGVHLTLPWHLVRNDIAVIISVPKDKRSLFLIPWGPLADGTFERCYVGTTDTDFVGSLDDPQTNADDLGYVLRALNHSITSATGEPITAADVTAVWAGLRPLVKSATSGRTADLSRRHQVTTSPNGVVSVTGGKLTTYRAMAADTVDVVMERLGRAGRSPTARLLLHGAGSSAPSGEDHLVRRFGTDAEAVRRLTDADPDLARPLVPGLAYLRAEAVHGARDEMATTLVDVLARRTRAHLEDRSACLAAAPDVADLLARHLGWDERRTTAEVAAYVALCDAELAAATVPDARHAVSQGAIETS
jgi:glycerol-3-phosphate dehydrogenase